MDEAPQGEVRVIWLDSALDDLASIDAYLRARNPVAADRVVAAILETGDGLHHWSRRGRPGRLPGTRELVMTRYSYFLIYRVTPDSVEIFNVVHGARPWPPL
jgi:toxin ParE1/3/4